MLFVCVYICPFCLSFPYTCCQYMLLNELSRLLMCFKSLHCRLLCVSRVFIVGRVGNFSVATCTYFVMLSIIFLVLICRTSSMMIFCQMYLYTYLLSFFIWTNHSVSWDGWWSYSTVIEEEIPISFSGKHLILSSWLLYTCDLWEYLCFWPFHMGLNMKTLRL